ncbi:MAG: hypothetical protein ACHREM_10785 [Polyangiales bacterium]
MSARVFGIGLSSSLLVLGACRFGGPASEVTQPSLDAQWLPDVGVVDTGTLPGDEPNPEDTFAPGDDTSDPDADASDESSQTSDADAGIDGDSASAETGACTPPTPATCDPVKNTGCNILTRCDVSSTFNTGQCVDLGALGVGAGCTTSAPFLTFPGTDTCNHGLTCLSGSCVALCYCDSDCSTGQCCSVSTGSGGFKACGGC